MSDGHQSRKDERETTRTPFARSPQHRRYRRHLFFLPAILGLCLVLIGAFDSSLVYAAPAKVVASVKGAPSKPNRANPSVGTTSKNQAYKPGAPGPEKPHAPQTIPHNTKMPMKTASIDLQVGKQSKFLGSDKRLELLVPAGAITTQDLQEADGKVTLQVTQVAPASGSNAGGNGLSLGTYLIQLVDAHGHLLTHGLRKAITAHYHIQKDEEKLGLERAYVLLNGSVSEPMAQAQGVVKPLAGKSLASTVGKPQKQKTSLSLAAKTLTVTPQISTPSTSLSWNSDASIAYWGAPDPFATDLSTGALTSNYPLDVPKGPGGLTPSVNLSYNSESVNSQHGYSSAAGWVGEGWNLSMGEITWSQHNVTAGCTPQPSCGTNWENSWYLSDPYGTSSELIPPDIYVSTYYDATSNVYCAQPNPTHNCPILWHAAHETHAKIYSYVGNINIPNQTINPPCWRVWLPNGTMEEFGCTSDSLQYYYVAGGHAEVSGWLLDLITDPQGNQIHFTYQRDMASWTDPTTNTTYSYPRDVELGSIQYDSPTCHDAQNMCTGSNWAPLMQVVFNASHTPSSLTGTTPSNCTTGSNLRCDDPNGASAPLVQHTYVLNSVNVQVRTSGTGSWNTLNTYQLGYEQSGPTTTTDPASGLSVSVAGMLDLTQMQQIGSAGLHGIYYSGNDTNSTTSFAYEKAFDLSSKNVVVGPNTTLSYWIFPQSHTNNGLVSGNNSTCVALDMIFTDGSDLRDSGAVDQSGNRLHPASQCNRLTLDQWNLVTSKIGAAVNGKTINRIDIGYDQGANTGGYRGYIDNISLTNPNSATPLFATSFEGSDPQLSWTNTVDTGPEAGAGKISNVGGICCGLTGPELNAANDHGSTDSAAEPIRTFTYTTLTNYYEDTFYKPNPSTNCGPSWNTGTGSGCLLWEQSYANNSRFMASSSNGEGLAENYTWMLARNNSHGVPNGGSNNADPFYCNSHQTTSPCQEVDDSGWSHAVLTQKDTVTSRLSQNGQVGAQSTWLTAHGANDGNWAGNVQSMSVPVTLNAGNNSIQFSNASGWAPNFDRITVGGQSYEAEAAGNTLSGGAATIANCSTCSGGAQVYLVGKNGTLQFNNINVATAGSYSLTIYFINGDPNRAFQMVVNGVSTPITSTTGYGYQLNYPLTAQECSDCVAGMYWGDQNDIDYLNYYNGTFMGFAQATVSLPTGAKVVHNFYAGEGWGIYDTNPQQVTCYTKSACHASPWWDVANAAHGQEYKTLSYDIGGQTLLQEVDTTYQATCPPSGVSPTPPVGTVTWDGHLVSMMDHNNPIAVCDIQQMQQVSKTSDGTSNTLTTTSNRTYDSYGRVTQEQTTTNGGTPTTVVKNMSYVWNDAVTATKTSASGTYILDTVALSTTEDGSGNRLSCSYTSYDGQSYATGQMSSLSGGLATTKDAYSDCGNASNSYTPSGKSSATTVYNVSGDEVAGNDADANAGISGHTGCTLGSTQYTSCSTIESTFGVFPASSTNALNQTSSTSYANTTAQFGYGTWPISTTDANNQVTSVTYDTLGRTTGIKLPNESSSVTKQWVYTNWCNGSQTQTPCTELDEIDRLTSTSTTTTRAFYDGLGRLVETRAPGPVGQDVVAYAFYDTAGRQVFKSTPYFVVAYTGAPGSAAYAVPDTSQVGTSTTYSTQTLLQTSVTDPNSHTTSTTDTVICSVPGTSDTGCYEQQLVLDANGHQSASLTGGLGKANYAQTYTGNSSPYTLYATTTYTYNSASKLISTQSPDGSIATKTYDDLGHVTNANDPDYGITSATYDPNGNITQATDARGASGTVYVGYDGLNRVLWRNSTNSATGAWVSYGYDSTANSNNGVGHVTSEQFSGSGGLSGSYSYLYDVRGQQLSETVAVNGTNYTLQASYNDGGQVTSQTYPTGEVVAPGYDANGWGLGLTTTTGGTTTTIATNLQYQGNAGAAGHPTSLTFGNGQYSLSASYDSGMRVTNLLYKNVSSGTTLLQEQPGYDAVNNVVTVSATLPDGTDNQQFCYDNLNRMTWSGSTGTPPCATFTAGTLTSAQYQESDAFNTEGQLTTGPAGGYTYGDSKHPHAVTATGNGYTASYDAAGNMVCRALTSATTCNGTQTGQQLGYDPEGRLSTWQDKPSSPSSTANYLYDGEGNRVATQTASSGNTTTTTYIGNTEEVQQTTGSSAQITTYYGLGGARLGANVGGTFYYFGYDILGSQVLVLNSSGSVAGEQLFGPYGNKRYTYGTLPTSIGFTGQRSDNVTGLDYYVARYYDPNVGQFISPDSMQGNPQGMSPYAYVKGNPESFTDPSGHMQMGTGGGDGECDCNGTAISLSLNPPPDDPPNAGVCHSYGCYDNGGNLYQKSGGNQWKKVDNKGGGTKGNFGKPKPKTPSSPHKKQWCATVCGGIVGKDWFTFAGGAVEGVGNLALLIFILTAYSGAVATTGGSLAFAANFVAAVGAGLLHNVVDGLATIISSFQEHNPILDIVIDLIKIALDIAGLFSGKASMEAIAETNAIVSSGQLARLADSADAILKGRPVTFAKYIGPSSSVLVGQTTIGAAWIGLFGDLLKTGHDVWALAEYSGDHDISNWNWNMW